MYRYSLQGSLREARNRNHGQVQSLLKACARHMRWREPQEAIDKIAGAIAIGVITERDVFRATKVPLELLREGVEKYWAMFPEDRPIYERENRELEREKNQHAVKYGEAHP